MKVFEDLIEELKEENLIEETVIESTEPDGIAGDSVVQSAQESSEEVCEKPLNNNQTTINMTGAGISAENNQAEVVLPVSEVNENDFYRRRAMEEVSSLQMVERILTAVEREQAKISPKPYDYIPVSKALHYFLQVSKIPNHPESAAAEFKLMQETESWYSALAHRDQSILPAHLRRYCETTKPGLSSQALASLARFYRNSPYSESVRSKFDLVITRLFSKEFEDEQRQLLFSHEELLQHLSELYADWSSIPLYSTDDETELTLAALKFEDFITEAINAVEFEELVRTDFFNRLRAFKESTGENFFAPVVTATAINCNIRVGNRYIELLKEEKRKNNGEKLEDKYSQLLDQTISEATSKTFQLVQILREKSVVEKEKSPPVEITKKKKEVKKQQIEIEFEEGSEPAPVEKAGFFSTNLFKVNKWILGLMIFTFVATLGLYSWVEFVNPVPAPNEVRTLEMEAYYFKEYLQVAKISNEVLIGVANPSWFELSGEKKEEAMKNMLAVGKEKGYKSVRVLSREGKTVGYIHQSNITSANSQKK